MINLVKAGHEPVRHGTTWSLLVFIMGLEEEEAALKTAQEIIKNVTGFTCEGFNAYWMTDSNNTLEILSDLGLTYHVDDLSFEISHSRRWSTGNRSQSCHTH